MNVARNIACTGKFDDALFYRAICDCSDSSHDQHITIETDLEVNSVIVTIYQQLNLDSDLDYHSLWKRIKTAVRYVVFGDGRVSGEFMMSNEAVNSYLGALTDAIAHLREGKRTAANK